MTNLVNVIPTTVGAYSATQLEGEGESIHPPPKEYANMYIVFIIFLFFTRIVLFFSSSSSFFRLSTFLQCFWSLKGGGGGDGPFIRPCTATTSF